MLVACGGPAGPALAPPPNDTPARAQSAAKPAGVDTPVSPLSAPPPSEPPQRQGTPSLAALPVYTEPGELPSLLVDDPLADAAKKAAALPLRSTRATIRVTPPVAEVEVVQRFENPRTSPVEVVYVFPLPENAAVHGFSMRTGDREIVAKVDERERARSTYRTAKKAGLAAALLEQERANVFVESIANVAPGKAIEVTTRYVQDLTYDAGIYEVVFPLVVGPREARDGSRITPPYLGQGERSGQDVAIEVIADKAAAPKGFVAVTHELSPKETTDGTVAVALARKDKIANRDFVLRFEAATEGPRATLLTSSPANGYFILTVEPPRVDVDAAVGRRDIIFAVDVSGSMAGVPLALTKRALRLALERLRPVDAFDIVTFSQGSGRLFGSPRPANEEAIEQALAFVDRMHAQGGTYFVDAVAAALAPATERGRRRDVLFFTDGYVSADDLIVRETRKLVGALEARGDRAKVFAVGVGAAPNRALLESIAREGGGAAVYLSNREDPARAMKAIFRHIDSPVLHDVKIDWADLEVSDVTPALEPDLLASRPLVIHGRLTERGRAASITPVLRAESASGPVTIPITRVDAGGRSRVLGALWGRARIAELDADYASGDRAARFAITRLGLELGLVTRFTSLVAFDRGERISDGAPELLLQPAELPEGVEGGLRKEDGEPKTAMKPSDPIPAENEYRGSAPSSAPPEAERGPRGCFCRAGESGEDAPWAAFIALALLLCSRRRAR